MLHYMRYLIHHLAWPTSSAAGALHRNCVPVSLPKVGKWAPEMIRLPPARVTQLGERYLAGGSLGLGFARELRGGGRVGGGGRRLAEVDGGRRQEEMWAEDKWGDMGRYGEIWGDRMYLLGFVG